QGEHEKLSVVEDSERLHAGCPKSEKQNLNTCDYAHQNGLDCVVNPRMGDPQLFGHRHHRCADHEDLNPREVILTPLDQGGPRISEDEPPGYEKKEDIQEARRASEWPSPRCTVEVGTSHGTGNRAIRASGIYP